jgi:hypothetical protein
VCERCVRCKGGAVPGVSQSPEVRGRVREETHGRLCSSASRCQGERGVQRARGDRQCSKERGWVDGIFHTFTARLLYRSSSFTAPTLPRVSRRRGRNTPPVPSRHPSSPICVLRRALPRHDWHGCASLLLTPCFAVYSVERALFTERNRRGHLQNQARGSR